ncbi:hypothetical protein CLAFUW4_00080 [Fulvia fulva]|uniref:SP-RING-type domain-containing protein n=1 Tax=Passalora fulva TaxID=5499 RepID=A0A9Q8L8F7_PASFU|nr:uncharacterized protein CLAFUR5_00078 [Fulvia fulva]KAK4635064.1 hypothetical protein CLAFUR4_00080 [Fulvia fulva]KAK4636662.1 hypothetical protein CLAFUR0_00079 [Fulvia fulva]UJO12715.1 hypothetical protein CLAFUR5_00078 [Fulvia fulva]WPV09933.1 hypothetical protein CLAFUW4_00080 [Fulvia fulva]WPV23228.1 hypothetical protein CLAFUW7_00080 [Fulvia fulva]
MASRARQSTARPTPTPTPSRSGRQSTVQPAPRGGPTASITEPPEYEAPQFPINPQGQRALAALSRSHDLSKLEKRFKDAQTMLTQSAMDINDILHEKDVRIKKTREKHEPGDDEESDAFLEQQERSLKSLREKTESMTTRMEEQMRRTVDGRETLQLMKESVEAAHTDARNHASTQASTQPVRSQRRRRTEGGDGEEAEESNGEDDEIPDFQPTDPGAAGTQAGRPPVEVFREQVDDRKTRYQILPMSDRYASNEEYVNFRRVIHDAQYPDDDIEMAPPEEWFNEDGTVPPPGTTARPRAGADEDDSDEEIAISRANISTKCPLTLRELNEPYSSKKCPHTFEKASIMEFLASQSGHCQCPVPGCNQMLSYLDLHVDGLIVRKIKRIQRAAQAQAEEGSDEEDDDGVGNGTQRNAFTLHSDIDGVEDDATPLNIKTQPKSEPRPTGASGLPGSSQAPRSTQVVDLGDSDEEEDEDQTMED